MAVFPAKGIFGTNYNSSPMKRSLLLLFLSALSVHCFAQLERENTNIILDYQNLSVVRFADIDNDGDLDIVGSKFSYLGNFVVYLQDDATGQFVLQQVFGDTTWVDRYSDRSRNFDLADMDNDGDIDLIPADLARSNHPFLENDGNGRFAAEDFQYTSADRIIDDFYFRSSDLDQDGDDDILSFRLSSGDWQFFLNRNQGNSAPFVESSLLNADAYFDGHLIEDLLLFDFDLDNDLDILVVSRMDIGEPEHLITTVFEQTCTLCFELQRQQTVAVAEKSIRSASAKTGLLDQDAFPDVGIMYHYTDSPTEVHDELLLLKNDLANDTITVLDRIDDVEGFSIGDYDLDGDQDLWVHFTSGHHSGSYSWLENQGDFPFLEHHIDHNFSGEQIINVDLNQDNRLDLVTFAWNRPGSVGVRYNEAGNNYAEVQPLLEYFSAYSIVPEDGDGDGLMDFYFFGDTELDEAYQDGIFRIHQSAIGEFEPPERVYTCEVASAPKRFLDLNLDGRTDAIGIEGIVPSSTPFELKYTLQQADGTWTTGTRVNDNGVFRVNSFAIADWDQDNDPDLLVRDEQGQLRFFENELPAGIGFSLHPVSLELPAADFEVVGLWAGDIDLDGWPDIVARTEDQIRWARSVPAPFELSEWVAIPVPFGTQVLDVDLADFNGDGHPNLLLKLYHAYASGRRQRNEIAFFDPSTQGFLPLVAMHETFSYALPTEVRDFNFDGAPDLFDVHGIRLNLGQGLVFSTPILPSPVTPPGFYNTWNGPAILSEIHAQSGPQIIIGTDGILAFSSRFVNSSNVIGEIRWDTTGLCQYNSIHPFLPHWRVLASEEGGALLAMSNFAGRYGLAFPDTGTYQLQVEPPSGYWATCPVDTLLEVIDSTTQFEVNFAADALVDCPLVKLEIGRTPIRQCFPSTISIGFENIGTAVAEEVEIKLSFDSRFIPTQASLPWQAPNDSCMVFNFTAIDIGEMGMITIQFEPSCEDLLLGEEICFTATVSPDVLCEVPDQSWDGASLQAQVVCAAEGTSFEITNTGTGATGSPVSYTLSSIVNDDIILYLEGTVILSPGETDTIQAPNNGSIWYLEMNQTEGHPYPAPIALLNNQCLTEPDSTTAQQLNQLFTEDGSPFVATTCGEVIGPYDPNDKTATPTGLTDLHYVERHRPIDYTIQFQNVGTDFARNVVLEDSLSSFLDLSTFTPLTASADYRWALTQDGFLRILFPDINLADSTSNEAASHGFFSFRITPKADAPFEEDIFNFADIFFDFNAPIRTGTTQHRIRKPVRATSTIIELCQGDEFMGQIILQDTIIRDRYVFTDYDSIQYYHLSVVDRFEEEVFVSLSEPGTWSGWHIEADTLISRTFIASGGCDSLVHYYIDVLSELSEAPAELAVNISPNPADEQMFIQWSEPFQLEFLRVINVAGQFMDVQKTQVATNRIAVDTHRLPPGSYDVSLYFAEGNIRRRIVVVH